jgi:23S rRNA A2030 N6-methylase RlmJ
MRFWPIITAVGAAGTTGTVTYLIWYNTKCKSTSDALLKRIEKVKA